MIKIGSHVSYSKNGMVGCINETLGYGGNSFMFYTGAPQNTIRKDIDPDNVLKAHELMKLNGISVENVIVHAPYIVNLATADSEKHVFAIEFLKKEIERCKLLGIKTLCLHPGNAVGIDSKVGLNNLISALEELICDEICITIETMAGKGTEICRNLEELAFVVNAFRDKNIGVTLDTCHLHDSGVAIKDFDDYLDKFDKLIGLDKIKCVHINDSKNIFSSHKDRHENFGYGEIGFDALLSVCYNEKLKDVPKILETPYVKFGKLSFAPYKHEIDMIKEKTFNQNLINDILDNNL